MAVEVRYVNVEFVPVDKSGNVIDKNSNTTTLDKLRSMQASEHRVIARTDGPAAAPNSVSRPSVPAYLQAEADDGFALAYMDQYTIITQRIT